MKERRELNRLVVRTLRSERNDVKANYLYDRLRFSHPHVLRKEKVTTFRGFVKVLNSFSNVQQVPRTGVKTYTLRNVYITRKG